MSDPGPSHTVFNRRNQPLELHVAEGVREERDAQSIKEALARWQESQDGRTSQNNS